MANDIDSYLRELQGALTGSDPALVQDALFDAEEHLRAEMASGRDFDQVMDSYGSPAEVAAAYRGTTDIGAGVEATAATTAGALPAAPPPAPQPQIPAGVQAGMAAAAAAPPQPGALRQIFGVVVDPAVYKALLYMLLSLATGTVYFTIVVTGLSTSFGMIILIIGLPLLLLTLGLVRAMALFEGRVVEVLLGTRMPRRPRSEPPDTGFFQRIWFWLKDGRTWASLVYLVLMLPLGIAYFTIAVTGLTVGLVLITTPLWIWFGWLGEHTFVYQNVTYEWWFPLWATPLAMVCGAVVLLLWLHAVKWIGRGHAAFAKAMLVRLAK